MRDRLQVAWASLGTHAISPPDCVVAHDSRARCAYQIPGGTSILHMNLKCLCQSQIELHRKQTCVRLFFHRVELVRGDEKPESISLCEPRPFEDLLPRLVSFAPFWLAGNRRKCR